MRTRVDSPAPSAARGRSTRVVVGVVAAAVAIAAVVAIARYAGRDNPPATTSQPVASTALPARSIDAGAVAVKIQPLRLDANGATFKISFDTHSGALDVDVANEARLVVGTTPWPVSGWSGDGPGGHHREGELSFSARSAASGTATLTIDGLPQPVTATWALGV